MKPTNFSHFQKSFSKNKKIISETTWSITIFAIMILIISNPSRFSQGTISGLNLFISSVLPGLFPFMLLTKLLTEIGLIFKLTNKCDKIANKIFGTPGISLYVAFMSILSGYPIGAKIISDLFNKGLISEKSAKKMSIFCTTSGPIFIIGAVGCGMFNDIKIGVIIYIAHILSSFLLGILYNILTKDKSHFNKNTIVFEEKTNIFSTCITDTINSLFMVAAYITTFYLLTELFEILNIFNFLSNTLFLVLKNIGISLNQSKSLVYGFLEVTRGCKSFSQNISPLSISLCCGIISFSGASIIMQSMAFLKNTKIKMHSVLFSKLVHFILSTFICFLSLIIFM